MITAAYGDNSVSITVTVQTAKDGETIITEDEVDTSKR